MARIVDSVPPKVCLSEEFESPQVLGINWWANVSYTANFPLGASHLKDLADNADQSLRAFCLWVKVKGGSRSAIVGTRAS